MQDLGVAGPGGVAPLVLVLVDAVDVWEGGEGGQGGLFGGLAGEEVSGGFCDDEADREVRVGCEGGDDEGEFDGGDGAACG